MTPMNPAYGSNPWATPNGTQAGADFLRYRASQQPTFTMGADGQAQWSMPNALNMSMGATPGAPGMTSTPSYGGYSAGASNPNLSAQADDIQRRVQETLGRTMAGIQGNSVGVGNLGGARQGVAQGIATAQGMDNLSGQLAGLYGNAWESQQNRGLQKYGMDQNYSLGYRGQDLSRYGMDQNFYTAQRGQDQSQARLGLDAWGLGTQGAWTPINNANSVYGRYTGFGPETTSGQVGGGWQGGLGGLLGAGQYAWDRGWFGNPVGK